MDRHPSRAKTQTVDILYWRRWKILAKRKVVQDAIPSSFPETVPCPSRRLGVRACRTSKKTSPHAVRHAGLFRALSRCTAPAAGDKETALNLLAQDG